jgi:hypothetical protein
MQPHTPTHLPSGRRLSLGAHYSRQDCPAPRCTDCGGQNGEFRIHDDAANAFECVDAAVISGAFDAEFVWRERYEPVYELAPSEDGDASVVACAGGVLASGPLSNPVLIYLNPVEAL